MMRMLLCTNGSSYTTRALDLGLHFAQAAASAVDILVVGGGELEEEAEQLAAEVAARLETSGVEVAIHRRIGRMREAVVEQARTALYDLVVIGSRGRRGIVRLLLGSTALHVTGHVPASVLVVKGPFRSPKRFLVCSAAGPASEETVRFSGRLANALGASMTILHVMSQLPMAEDALLDDLEAEADELIQRDSREGRHLSRMLSLLTAEGIPVRAVVRHGLVVDEIIAEAREGQYDLLVIGSHVTPGLNESLIDDLRADILLAINRPVLVIDLTGVSERTTSQTQGSCA
ncbi:MAG: universal stress protein [Anaerolineae bacterium]|jgi:nucleotide-binding universal stress UspA family protein